MIQVGSSVAGDASKPTSEKLKERGQDLLGKFVEEQLKNIKITNVEEQLKPKPTEGGQNLLGKFVEEQLKPKPTEGGQNLLGKFVEEQLKNIKITNVEEQLKTDPKITKVNKAIQRYISIW